MPNTSVGIPRYRGTAATNFTVQVLRAYGRTCHLCGRPGATTADHLIPKSQRPDLMYDVTNARPAHRVCNSIRRTKALPTAYVAAGW